MSGPLGQITMLVGITCALRTLGRWAGPRRSGLLLGLPSTTAMALLGCAMERGPEEATTAAEACLAGLVAAAALPLIFARVLEARAGLPAALASGVLGYLAVATGLWWLPGLGPAGCGIGAATGVLLIAWVSAGSRFRDDDEGRAEPDQETPRKRISPVWRLATRVGVPLVYVLVIRTLRAVAGPEWSGRFITFPGASLALLIVTHLEAGPGAAGRLALALPTGSVATLAFLTAFRFGVPALGLGWGMSAGYLAAVVILLSVAWSGSKPALFGGRKGRVVRRWVVFGRLAWPSRRLVWVALDRAVGGSTRSSGAGLRCRSRRGFAPRLEALAG